MTPETTPSRPSNRSGAGSVLGHGPAGAIEDARTRHVWQLLTMFGVFSQLEPKSPEMASCS